MAGRHRILYLDTAPTVGGSVVSLYELLRKLDRTRYDPLVVVYAPHEYVERFRAWGVEVVVWNVYQSADHRPAWMRQTRTSPAARWLRQASWGSSLYHAPGFAALLVRRVWPRARALQRIIVQQKVDLVHTNIRVGHDREGIIAARLAGVPCVCHVRHFETLGWFDRRLASSVASFIYISEAVQKTHLGCGVPRAKGRVVYNGLDVSAFVSGLDRGRGRQILNLAPGDLAGGLVGRLEPWKGHEVFLRAIAQLRQQVPRARGVVIGDPVPHEPDYPSRLSALRDELGLSEAVVFSQFRMDLSRVMSALDVLVLASVEPEPFGRVLIEAMAAGKPVVATDAGAAREIIEDGVQGFLVPCGDAQALARAVVRALIPSDLAMAMGQRGQARVRERFDAQQYVDGVQAVYGELLAA